MRRIGVVLVVMAMGLAIASPATAKKPDKPKPPSAVPVAVHIGAEPVWVHEGADVIRYTVTLENKTSDTIGDVASRDDVAMEFTAAIAPENVTGIVIPANGTVTAEFSRTVSQFDESGSCEYGDECPLPATASVFINDNLVTQAAISTPLMPSPPCGFNYSPDDKGNPVSNSVLVADGCIWALPIDGERTGVWGVTLEPTPPKKLQRPVTARVTVRDGIPGNWCGLKVGVGGGFGDRWVSGDPAITGAVYLPGDEDYSKQGLGDGVCLGGGAGGEYFEVGNPASFYLTANGHITVQWLGVDPSSWNSTWNQAP